MTLVVADNKLSLVPSSVLLPQLYGFRRVFAHTADIFFVRGIANPATVSEGVEGKERSEGGAGE